MRQQFMNTAWDVTLRHDLVPDGVYTFADWKYLGGSPVKEIECPKCHGEGVVKHPPSGPYEEWSTERCPACDGTGVLKVDEGKTDQEG